MKQPLTREQAIEILWSKLSPNVPITDYWRHVLGDTYGWAVDALVETSQQYCNGQSS